MKVFQITFIFAALFALPFHGHAAPNDPQPMFFSEMEDVPVMAGLLELTDQGLRYDTPQGRIVQQVLEISGQSQEAILRYYGRILPQFGWQNTGDASFVRGAEKITFEFEEQGEQGQYMIVHLGPR